MSENRTDWVKDAGWLSELIKAARNDEAEFDTLLRRLLVAHAESLAQPAPVAPAGEVRLSEEERDTLWTTAAEHAWRGVTSPPEALYAAVERILAARLAAAEQRVTERLAEAWDEGMSAWRTYLNGGQVPPNPYRGGGRG